MADKWANWLLERRFGGDAEERDRMVRRLAEFRDRVLAGARIEPGDVVLDVGCGDGLLGVGAIEQAGESGRVIFSDVSTDLLTRCREITGELGVAGRCQFVHSGLPGLEGIGDASVDVAMTRSVLIYVADKAAAFATLRRVLRPGGRLSIFEPINSFHHPEPPGTLWGVDVSGVEELAGKVKRAYRRHQPDNDAMTGFDERDLFAHAEAAGFAEVTLDYRAHTGPNPEPVAWDTVLKIAPNPLVPSFGEVLGEALDPAERDTLERHLRERIEAGAQRTRMASAYLTARA
jgi:ubiquinone/menaquinone biosynthesis C-methylase UbiE